jgi:hypothetical protein
MNDQPRALLSEQGMARRETIFRALLSAQDRRVVRRRAGLTLGAGTAVVLLGMAAWAAFSPGGAGAPVNPMVRHEGESTEVVRPMGPKDLGLVQIVSNDPTVISRYTARGDAGEAEVIGDHELEDWLVRSGRTPGMIRIPGRLILAADIPRPPAPGRG